MTVRLCAAGKRLRYEINVLWPHRDTKSDGWVSSAAHRMQNPNSDHDPDDTGMVRAIDIDEDLTGRDGADPLSANLLAQQLVNLARLDDRIKYVIFEGKIASDKTDWKWATYTGPNSHAKHLHVSFTTAGDRDGRSFKIRKV